MAIDAKKVKELREQTGIPMMECKRALEETDGNVEAAKELLRMRGAKIADKKAHRETGDGTMGMYLHHDKKLAVVVEVNCETDFVAKNEDFQKLAKEIALHIAFHDPIAVRREEVPEAVVAKERELIIGQLNEDEKLKDKPEQMKEKIAEGKLEKFFAERCLLEQPFVRDDKLTVQGLINERIQTLGENITVSRFVRYRVGEE